MSWTLQHTARPPLGVRMGIPASGAASAEGNPMRDDTPREHEETYSQWTIVNIVFGHLVEQGLHPTLGDHGDPGEQAAKLLHALGITPTSTGDARVKRDVHDELAQLRAVMMGEK